MIIKSNTREYVKVNSLPDSRYIDEETPVADPIVSTSHVAAAFRSAK